MAPEKKPATKRAKPSPPAARTKPTVAEKPATPKGVQRCPRCGATKFAPEERIRVEGTRTFRYTVLVCERGHTFAKPRVG